ncbi:MULTISPECIES: hypothetical protein [unclassified Streptomyces]|uniref:hypothetical protein n=1 Tax=unclassified Streptomyces TaxID=2593676 RepID=UPI0037F514AC
MADVISRNGAARSDLVRWLAFSLLCAGGSLGLSWLGPVVPLPTVVRGVGGLLAILILPLASLLVPVLLLRRVPRKKRKVAWQLIVPPIAGVALGVLGTVAGGATALADRGVSADAVVVSADYSSTNHCELRTVDGQDISPSLSESDGCRDSTSKGDELRVRYDPEGVASPDDGRTSSHGVLLTTLFGAAVVMGTWGGVRQGRWDRAYDGV